MGCHEDLLLDWWLSGPWDIPSATLAKAEAEKPAPRWANRIPSAIVEADKSPSRWVNGESFTVAGKIESTVSPKHERRKKILLTLVGPRRVISKV